MFTHLKRRLGVLAAVAVLGALVPVMSSSPVSAAPATTAVTALTLSDGASFKACPTSAAVPSAGFTDTTDTAVDCLKYYGITSGTTDTTFDPTGSVTRWQMALFITRTLDKANTVLPTGADQGFTDISGKAADIQLAINQLRQMEITIGKTLTPLTYAPDQYVTREEMALFLQRLLKAVPAGPGGNVELVSANGTATEIKSVDTDHNFTDLNSVSLMEMQSAIINLWNLGVTEVATATLYEPSVNISRLNMAQMMARALDHTNARPAGLSIVANPYVSASTNLTISVTHRTADFLPVAGSLVDTFRYLQTSTFGSSQFSSDGSCAQVVVTEVSSTLCYIDTAEKVTDAYGNITPFISATISGSVWEYYVWTAAAGTTYDNDVHGTGTVTMTVRG
ncbi:uncharacterized protein METZ01_LOCUS141331 [marine metagenome]|uniref:SLH domain-containing protein n=1 Tax=marine metagenome TaxID=408172 RepID=A0A381ZIA2_9ZZZZ